MTLRRSFLSSKYIILNNNPPDGGKQAIKIIIYLSFLQRFYFECVSKVKMSPLIAILKCPHGKGQIINERERADEVSSSEFGEE